MSKESLVMSIYIDPVFTALARSIGSMGCKARELADHVRPLTEKNGVKKLSAALLENHLRLAQLGTRKTDHAIKGI